MVGAAAAAIFYGPQPPPPKLVLWLPHPSYITECLLLLPRGCRRGFGIELSPWSAIYCLACILKQRKQPVLVCKGEPGRYRAIL